MRCKTIISLETVTSFYLDAKKDAFFGCNIFIKPLSIHIIFGTHILE